MLLVLAAWAGICCFALMFAVFLIKPLFSFTRSTVADNTVEIEREDCPLLFEAIKDIVKKTGNRMPKHIYLSADVNACVFFNSSFWSIFLPVRKNLKIGLGLFENMSVDEVKSILAHEFGHFGQSSMKVGSTVYLVNQVLYNLTYTQDFWDEWLDKWCQSSNNTFAFFGVMTRYFAAHIRQMNVAMYKFVEKSYLKLSRQMEFDADNVSCQYIGSNVFISAMCKTEVNSDENEQTIDALSSLIGEEKIIGNVFTADRLTRRAFPKEAQINLMFDKTLTKPVQERSTQPRVRVTNVWESHPSLKDRLENARLNPEKASKNPMRAWSMIPDEISQQVSDAFFLQLDDASKLQKISDDEYGEWVKKYVENAYMPVAMRPFFGKRVFPFEIKDEREEMAVRYPFTESNAAVINQCMTAYSDWNLLQHIHSGEVQVENISYDDIPVSVRDLPLEQHRTYLEDLANKTAALDKLVYDYLMSVSDEEKRKEIRSIYRILFYADNSVNVNLANLFAARNDIHQELIQASSLSEDDRILLPSHVSDYVRYLQDSIKEFDFGAVEAIAGKEYVDYLNVVLEKADKQVTLDNDYLTRIVITLPNELMDIHRSLLGWAKRQLCEVAMPHVDSHQKADEDDVSAVNYLDIPHRITIDMPEVNVAEKESSTASWLIFTGYVILIGGLCLCLQRCGKENNVTENTESTDYTLSQQSVMDFPGASEQYVVTANEGEVTDGRIAIKKFDGVVYERYYPDSTNINVYGWVMYDDAESPSYGMRVISYNMTGSFGYNDFHGFVASYEKNSELENCERTATDDDGYLDNDTFCYVVHKTYRTQDASDYNFHVDFAAIRSYDAHKICFIICESNKGTETPFNRMLDANVIRFK